MQNVFITLFSFTDRRSSPRSLQKHLRFQILIKIDLVSGPELLTHEKMTKNSNENAFSVEKNNGLRFFGVEPV